MVRTPGAASISTSSESPATSSNGFASRIPLEFPILTNLARTTGPDRSGVITQADGSPFEVFDAEPGADQPIEHVFHRFERRQGCHLGGLGDERWDAADVLIKALFDGLELLEQACMRSLRVSVSVFQYWPERLTL